MAASVQISEGLESSIISLAGEGAFGWLIGPSALVSGAQSIPVISAVRSLHLPGSQLEIEREWADLQLLLPSGLDIVGAFVQVPETDGKISSADLKVAETLNLVTALKSARAKTNVSTPEEEVHLVVAAAGLRSSLLKYFVSSQNGTKNMVEAVPSEIVPGGTQAVAADFWQSHALLRCQVSVAVPVYISGERPTGEAVGQALARALEAIEEDLRSPRATFLVEPPPGKSGTSGGPHLVQLSQASSDERGTSAYGEGESQELLRCGALNQSESRIPVPANVSVLFRQSSGTGKPLAPVLQYLPANGKVSVRRLHLKVDVLAVAPAGRSLEAAIAGLVVPALCVQLQGMRHMAARESSGAAEIKLAAYHFCPPGFCHPVTAIYPLSYGEAEKGPVEIRKALHLRLGLPQDRPLLRTANALTFAAEAPPGTAKPATKRLLDVHVGLPPSGVAGGRQSLVQGSYEYFHYLQDRVDDNGWGCAYRSLQTLISWFRLQHYTGVPVPTHRKIQETLVEMGDKEAPFLGSSQWIGAIELSYVLDQLLGVSCKILTVQSGADMPTKGRELARHFQTQGTPIMIGGGVLAYTLLGVDYNELTGECAFLILDPHYTGGEDIKSIRSGGWVGWKKAVTDAGQDFFVRNAFYNLLLPQRPAMV